VNIAGENGRAVHLLVRCTGHDCVVLVTVDVRLNSRNSLELSLRNSGWTAQLWVQLQSRDILRLRNFAGCWKIRRKIQFRVGTLGRRAVSVLILAALKYFLFRWRRTTRRGLTGRYRLLWLRSTASAAESFRSRCGSVRRAPACSSQASSVAAPQVGQGTDNICFRVSSLVFTAT